MYNINKYIAKGWLFNMSFIFNLESILTELEITKNHLSRESKVRPATILDLASGKTKRLELPTIQTILDTLNKIAVEKGNNKTYTIDDLIKYQYNPDTE